MAKSAVGHIYWKNSYWKTLYFVNIQNIYQNHLSELNSNDQSVFKMSFLNALKLKNEDISNVG